MCIYVWSGMCVCERVIHGRNFSIKVDNNEEKNGME